LVTQRILLVGAGAAGIGIARLAEAAMRVEDAHVDPRPAVLLLDSRGLVFDGREHIDDDKRPFALPGEALARYGFAPADRYDLETVIRQVAPTILVGTTGSAGAFTETAIRELAARVPAPIVLPMSNPTANAEATPAEVFAWSGGRALVATGSPFDPVLVDGRPRLVGQANNVFVFPGVGLGAIVSGTGELTDRMFLAAADTLARMTSAERIRAGALYPPLADLRRISRAIAIAVVREAVDAGLARLPANQDAESAVDGAMWTPQYRVHAPSAA
jgi:malic enzyme